MSEAQPRDRGRPRGAVSEANRMLKEAARAYGLEAIAKLYDLMVRKDVPPAVQMACAEKLIDRGFGRPTQAVELSGPEGEAVDVNLITKAMTPKEAAEAYAATLKRKD